MLIKIPSNNYLNVSKVMFGECVRILKTYQTDA